ncbi:MAG: T9SS type A sorting domain-containing protein [Flavobacteriales bacterium]|nr:T9SS type A sorting domain-containing protein [Flavobacteriales bacterium]
MRDRFILFILLAFSLHQARAATCSASDNGNWETSNNWSCGSVPVSGDWVIIPAGITVSITSNLIYSGSALRIRIYGTLSFVGGGAKLSLPCGSIVELMSSSAQITGTGSGSSQTLKICGTTYWQASSGTRSGPIVWPTNATLPVELILFKANAENGSVDLVWSTASESNSSHFELSRSTDLSQFTTIAIREAAGHSTSRRNYTHTDESPFMGTTYYRLLQYDLDATVHDQGIVSVHRDPEMEIRCYPSPASSSCLLQGAELSDLTVRDEAGRIITHVPYSADSRMLDVSGWPNGVYFITVDDTMAKPARCVVVHE